jgi:hypothetical protein
VFFKKRADKIAVASVADHQLYTLVHNRCGMAVCEVVEDDDLDALGDEVADGVGTDISGTAGDENGLV